MPADVPLSAEEAQQMRSHLRFLKEYRKELRLRLNATEDLLLNGAREPTHRGVCQHLLAKIDRARVMSAAERMDPMAATRLVEGILRISPDIDYVLLYLECVKRSASPSEATAALARGLERIDFAQVSHAQMRRVLDLIVELFDDHQLPELLLGLLEGKTFRRAFDESAATLPAPLAALVVPLRAAQAAILRGGPRPQDPALVRRGAELLLGSSDRTLRHYPESVRRQLFTIAVQDGEGSTKSTRHGLEVLYASLSGPGRSQVEPGLAFARHLLAAGAEAEARRILRGLTKAQPDADTPARWLEALDAPRLGSVALAGPPPTGDGRPSRQRRTRAGLQLPSMRPVWVLTPEGDDGQQLRAAEQLLRDLTLPNIATLIESGSTDDDRPYWVVSRHGHRLEAALDRKGGLSLQTALCVCRDAVAILGGLAARGCVLPDARVRRFDLEGNDRLWLVDASGLAHRPPDEVEEHHAGLAAGFCHAVFNRAKKYLAPPRVEKAIENGASLVALLQVIEGGIEA